MCVKSNRGRQQPDGDQILTPAPPGAFSSAIAIDRKAKKSFLPCRAKGAAYEIEA